MEFKKNEPNPVFAISTARTDREGNVVKKEGEAPWKEIGRAFENADGSISVYLEAAPMSGKLQIRKPLPKKDYVEMEDAR